MARNEVLDIHKPLFALSAFTYNGKRYQPGEPFNWRTVACSVRDVAALHNARRVRHTLPDSVKPASQLPTDPPPKREPPAQVQAATLEHTGAGWYNVVVDGLGPINESKLKGKESAAEWAAEQGYTIAEPSE